MQRLSRSLRWFTRYRSQAVTARRRRRRHPVVMEAAVLRSVDLPTPLKLTAPLRQ